MEAGRNVSYDDDLGHGWKHIAAMRKGGNLKLYIDGELVGTSSSFNPDDYDLSTDQPLRIGFGQNDYFSGKMTEIKMYNRALGESEIKKLSTR